MPAAPHFLDDIMNKPTKDRNFLENVFPERYPRSDPLESDDVLSSSDADIRRYRLRPRVRSSGSSPAATTTAKPLTTIRFPPWPGYRSAVRNMALDLKHLQQLLDLNSASQRSLAHLPASAAWGAGTRRSVLCVENDVCILQVVGALQEHSFPVGLPYSDLHASIDIHLLREVDRLALRKIHKMGDRDPGLSRTVLHARHYPPPDRCNTAFADVSSASVSDGSDPIRIPASCLVAGDIVAVECYVVRVGEDPFAPVLRRWSTEIRFRSITRFNIMTKSNSYLGPSSDSDPSSGEDESNAEDGDNGNDEDENSLEKVKVKHPRLHSHS
ncbi:hypothetical protein C8Q76DRAFT_799879 [Earliella scabrosa]|nr:hypothetical protein C8Q76DRAFT_799879 [Earliella scabrosa]